MGYSEKKSNLTIFDIDRIFFRKFKINLESHLDFFSIKKDILLTLNSILKFSRAIKR